MDAVVLHPGFYLTEVQREGFGMCQANEYSRMDDHQKLVKDCLKNNALAQKQLYELFAGSMLGICYRYTKSMNDAEEVLQQSFIKVFKNLGQYKMQGDLGAWIRRIVVNTAINYLKRKPRYQLDLSFDDTHLHPVTNGEPAVSLHMKDLLHLVRQLPPGYQAIFNLYAVEGYAHAEIGKILGINESTSRSQYARARALLINWLEKHSGNEKKDSYGR